jgi:hypothetical protein
MSAQTADGPDEQPDKAEVPLAFRIDALHHRVKAVSDLVHESVTKVSQIAQSMADTAMRAIGRGPDPDYGQTDDEVADRVARIIASRYGTPRYEYHEAPRGDDNGVKTLILGMGATLLCAFVGGGWILSNRVAALEARVTEWKESMTQRQNAADQRIDRLENRRP